MFPNSFDTFSDLGDAWVEDGEHAIDVQRRSDISEVTCRIRKIQEHVSQEWLLGLSRSSLFGDPLRHVSYVEVDVARVHAMSEAFDYLLRMY